MRKFEMINYEMEMMEAMLAILRLQTADHGGKMKTVQTTTPPPKQQSQQLPNLKATDRLTKGKHENSEGAPLGLGKGGGVV